MAHEKDFILNREPYLFINNNYNLQNTNYLSYY